MTTNCIPRCIGTIPWESSARYDTAPQNRSWRDPRRHQAPPIASNRSRCASAPSFAVEATLRLNARRSPLDFLSLPSSHCWLSVACPSPENESSTSPLRHPRRSTCGRATTACWPKTTERRMRCQSGDLLLCLSDPVDRPSTRFACSGPFAAPGLPVLQRQFGSPRRPQATSPSTSSGPPASRAWAARRMAVRSKCCTWSRARHWARWCTTSISILCGPG